MLLNQKNKATAEIDEKLKIMEVVENQLEKQKGEAIFCLTLFICSLCVWILFIAAWQGFGKPISEEHMKFGVELIATIMMVFILKFTRLDIRSFGLTKTNLKPALIRASIISTATIGTMLLINMFKNAGTVIFYWNQFDLDYLLTSVLQEFLARGFLLTTLLKINTTKNSIHISVICSSLVFACLHLYYGFTFMIGAGILSALLGYCYIKDENIWGVSLIHFVFGNAGLILGITDI